MTTSHRFLPYVLAFLLAFLPGCAGTSRQESAGEYLDDTVITTRVKAALFNEPALKSAQINVETFKGTVQLSGFVSTRAEITTAVRVARGVAGVTAVRNDMALR